MKRTTIFYIQPFKNLDDFKIPISVSNIQNNKNHFIFEYDDQNFIVASKGTI